MYPYFRGEQKFGRWYNMTGQGSPVIKKDCGGKDMKGYSVESGYMGYVNGEYMLFASEMDYMDYVQE